MKISGVNPTLNVRPAKMQSVQPPRAIESQVDAARRVANGSREQEPQPVTVTGVQDAVEEINKVLHYMNERLEFSVHEATNRVMVRVLDRETDEVLREIPPEQILDLVAKLQELVGLLVDKRA